MHKQNLFIILLLLFSTFVSSHICILYPPQRGTLNTTTPGDSSCYRRLPYCGSIPLSTPATTFVTNEVITMKLQQNLNHFFPSKPGFIDVAITSILEPTESDWTILTQIQDAPTFDMVVQTTLSLQVTLPSIPSTHSLLRVRYISYNPLEIDPANNTDAIFYNCADIAIVSSSLKPPSTTETTHIASSTSTASSTPPTLPMNQLRLPSDYSCSTPSSWIANFTETNPNGFVQHSLFWDSISKKTRWDKSGALDSSGISSSLSLINDYSKTPMPIEWVNFITAGACYAFGNDAFYSFSFGSLNNMTHVSRSSFGLDYWEIIGAPHAKWITQELDDSSGNCKPIAWILGESSVSLSSFATGPIDQDVFIPASSCTSNPIWGGCRKH
jgi:hypothetical protein